MLALLDDDLDKCATTPPEQYCHPYNGAVRYYVYRCTHHVPPLLCVSPDGSDSAPSEPALSRYAFTTGRLASKQVSVASEIKQPTETD